MSVVWQRVVDPATYVWVRPDDVVAIGDVLVDLTTGAARDEPPWPFLGLQPWSRQRWEPRIAAIAEQGPARQADRVQGRRWRDLLVVGRRTGTGPGMLVEARRVGSGERVWQHRLSGLPEVTGWSRWLSVTDGAVMERPDARQVDRDLVRHPDLERGGVRWTLPWQLDAAGPSTGAGTGEVVVLYDSDQPFVVGVDADEGVPRWRYPVPGGGIPVAVRATGRHVVVCAFPADLNRHLPFVSHGPQPPIRLAAPPAMTVTVHDRATGTTLWRHSWPWPETDGILASVEALTVAGPVVATQEGDLLHARRIDDGAPLWSLPVASLSTRPEPRHGIPLSFRGTARRSAWIWLQDFHGSVGAGTATTADTLIDPLTGRPVRLADVFHIGRDGLALTRARDTLTCLALPLPVGYDRDPE